MKYILAFLSFIAVVYAKPAWVMTKCSAPLSYHVDFDCLQEDGLTAKVVRSGLFTPRYFYDLYSSDGAFLARAVNRVFSLGLFFADQMELDVYDETYRYIGYVGGKLWTNDAKFVFKNADGVKTGFAFLSSDSDRAIFSILSPANAIVAALSGTLSGDLSKWELELKQPVDIDSRVLKIFTAFVSDFHDSFIRKPEIHNHFYINNLNQQ